MPVNVFHTLTDSDILKSIYNNIIVHLPSLCSICKWPLILLGVIGWKKKKINPPPPPQS